jgi:hypothetical protein
MEKSKFLLPAIVVLFLFSCKKQSTNSNSTVEFQLKTANRTSVVNRVDGAGSITWTSGFASATEIKLEAKNSAQQQVEYKSESKQKVDLFTSVAGSLGNVILSPGTYTEVEFRIELSPSGADAALQLDGSFTNGNTGAITPVSFRINSIFEIKGEKNNVTITDNSGTTALTTLDLSVLTTGISQAMLSSATITGGSIIISSSSNVALYNIIVANLQLHHEAEINHH